MSGARAVLHTHARVIKFNDCNTTPAWQWNNESGKSGAHAGVAAKPTHSPPCPAPSFRKRLLPQKLPSSLPAASKRGARTRRVKEPFRQTSAPFLIVLDRSRRLRWMGGICVLEAHLSCRRGRVLEAGVPASYRADVRAQVCLYICTGCSPKTSLPPSLSLCKKPPTLNVFLLPPLSLPLSLSAPRANYIKSLCWDLIGAAPPSWNQLFNRQWHTGTARAWGVLEWAYSTPRTPIISGATRRKPGLFSSTDAVGAVRAQMRTGARVGHARASSSLQQYAFLCNIDKMWLKYSTVVGARTHFPTITSVYWLWI